MAYVPWPWMDYFPFAFCLATTIFNRARLRTADSLLFICAAISAAPVPDEARARMRSSSYGVQTRPADFISPSPSAPLRVCPGQLFASEPLTLCVLSFVRPRGLSCRLRALLAVERLPRASMADLQVEVRSFPLYLLRGRSTVDRSPIEPILLFG